MSHNEMLAMLSLVGMFALFCFGFPIAYTMLFAGVLFGFLGIGWKLVTYLLTVQFYQVMNDSVMVAIPFFLVMGYMLEGAGLMERLFSAFQKLFAKLPGSLYMAVISTGTLFAAATGIVGSSVNLLCVMAEPTMRKGGYDVRMGAGSIAAAGTLGILIPPSIMLVVLGPMVGVPVTDLFIAAVPPGLLLASLYILYSLIKCSIWPKYGPPLPPELRPKSGGEVARELLVGAIPLLLLILSVLGSIMFGLATPTEASACGAFASIVMVIAYRKFTWRSFARAMFATAKMSAMILIMIASCNFFGAVFSRLGGATYLSNLLLGMNLAPMVMLCLILVIIFFMGWAMEWIPIVLILIPLLLPVVDAMGYDKLWFCMLVAVTLQTSWLSPPVALSAYFIKGALPHWKLTDIYAGMFQYICCQLIGVGLLLAFPEILTLLSRVLK
ncbi:MAG: TRAP transporter large permease subunit [Desulfovibrio desulfuricans]|jgi:tripartite ATP-independent transporter DctM subunit|nr:TRAP transporter large permease subunit [Desulfovibrio desulfuricans]